MPSGGFGSRLIQQTVRHQIGGTVTMEWLRTGLRCTVTMVVSGVLLSRNTSAVITFVMLAIER